MRFTKLVVLCALASLWLNGSVTVNIDVTLTFGATALILLAFIRR